MKVGVFYRCKLCRDMYFDKRIEIKSENISDALKEAPLTVVHECEEDERVGIAELIGAIKIKE
jgi:hypothetical protein